MRNFSFNEGDEYRDYRDADDEESVESGFLIPAEFEMMHMAQLDLASVDLNQRLLAESIRMLEKSWLWRFRSIKSKLELIKKSYTELTSLMEQVGNDEE